jgi:7-keto-8-aminopelargonate synthetase-like enzyme
VHRYPHGDLRSLERELARTPSEAGKLIVTDGIFSMEGTIVDLPGIMALAEFYGAEVLVDDAHSFGVLGEFGGGTAQHFQMEDRISLIMATFSKSLASIGGVVAGPEDVIHYLKHQARPLIFSASNPPASVAAVLAALDVIEAEPERREQLWRNTRRMQEGLRSLGYDIGGSETPIIPVQIGELERMLEFWKVMFDAGVFTNPVTPPAVPENSCRLRISLMATHTDAHIDFVLDAFATAGKRMAVI